MTLPPDPHEFDDTQYGAASARLRELVAAAREMRWFPARGPASASEEALVVNHLTTLQSFLPRTDLGHPVVCWVAGALSVLDALGPKVQPSEGWGDPYGITPWGRLLHRLHADVLSHIEADPAVRRLVGPPIWPLQGQPRLTAEVLYVSPPEAGLRSDARWAMLEHVQYNYWRTLEWALVWPDGLDRCPFYHLHRLHLAGLYPVGVDDGQFRVYYRNVAESVTAAFQQAGA